VCIDHPASSIEKTTTNGEISTSYVENEKDENFLIYVYEYMTGKERKTSRTYD